MDKIQAEQAINAYLADETKLYQDWYQAFYPPEGDSDLLEFAPPLSLNALKNFFKKQWFEEQQEKLREIICEKWGYAQKKTAFKNKQALIIAIAVDCLAIALSLPTTNTLTVATI